MIDETVNYDSGIRNYNRMLEGKRAFITTAARGIGKSIAILFARQGATVYFAGRNECYVRETESELQLLAPESRGYICDLADGAQSEETAALVLRDSGGIDILINTVGVNCHCAADGYKDEDMARLLETNYISGLRFARAFIPGMRARHGGSIVNISSIHSVMTQPTNMLYAGTKGAMNAAARAMALDCAADGIRVNTICPGVIQTDMCANVAPEVLESLREQTPIERLGRPEDIAQAMAYLIDAPFVTGQVLGVNGGFVIT